MPISGLGQFAKSFNQLKFISKFQSGPGLSQISKSGHLGQLGPMPRSGHFHKAGLGKLELGNTCPDLDIGTFGPWT